MLDRQTYFVREHVGMLKFSDTYDILDPETQQPLGIAKEKPGALVQILRLGINKRNLPTKVFVYEGNDPKDESKLLFSIQRGFSLFRAKVKIITAAGEEKGWLRNRIFTLGGAFEVYDKNGNQIAMVKGDWKGWNFKITDSNENEIGTITKKWAGVGKELFTTADNYVISLSERPDPEKAMLLLSAGLAVDTIFKEK